MAEDAKDVVRKMRKTAGDIAKSSPVLQISRAIERVGETVSEHAPEELKRIGRRLLREAQDAVQAIPSLKRRIGRGVRKATKTVRKVSRGRRRNAPRR